MVLYEARYFYITTEFHSTLFATYIIQVAEVLQDMYFIQTIKFLILLRVSLVLFGNVMDTL
jgi:hypothetical protein